MQYRQLFLLALVFVLTWNTFADGFYGVHSPNGNEVWAVGKTGSVFRSFDAGATWGSYPMGLADLRSVFSLGSNVWVVGDVGSYYYTTDAGANWSNTTLNGGVRLNAVVFVGANGWACGQSGSMIATTDGGVTWSAQTSGTAQHLYSLAFISATDGFASGAVGTLLKTTNGGTTWTNSSGGGWTKDILSVGVGGSNVYAVGVDGFARKSTDAGASWSTLPKFYTDSRSDVTGVHVLASDTALFIGGGGFVRKTNNAGATSTWGQHGMHASLVDIHFYNSQKGWAVSDNNNAIMRTTDGGATWSLPTGTTVSTSWVQKTTSSSIGNTFALNGFDKNKIYQVSGTTVRMSSDRGDTWNVTGSISGGGSTWSFYVSPKDTNIWLAATSGGGKSVRRSTNRGATWTQTLVRNFTSYGMPLEMDPDHPDTVLFAAEQTGGGSNSILYISTDFGATWDTLAATTMRSPCDVYIVPDSTNIAYIGDGVTGVGQGKMWRSVDGGKTWTEIYTNVSGVSEIPMIAASRLRPSEGYATGWGGGGFRKTSDGGLTWPSLTASGSTWGADIAKDDPNVVMYGLYGGGTSYLSTNAGVSFASKALSGSNSGLLAYDRATFLVHQAGDGIWKYTFSYTVPVSNAQAVTVTSPNGGESWGYNSIQNVTWTASNFANVNIDYQTTPGGSWTPIASGIMASAGSYAWSVPNNPTTQARIRVSDAGDANPQDSSNASFSIVVASISSTPSDVNFGTVTVGSAKMDTVRIYNAGTGTLIVSSVTNANGQITPGRTSFSIPAGSSDTLSVSYTPTSGGIVADTLIIVNNAPSGSLSIPLTGNAEYAIPEPIAPANNSAGRPTNDTLSWNAVPGALNYHLQIAEDTSFAVPVVDDSTLTGTSYPGSFSFGLTYYWRTNAITSGGPTTWSQVWSFTVTTTTTVQQSVSDGWNLISVPLEVGDASKLALYPSSVSNAYSYSASGYTVEDTLSNGTGYWLKFNGAEEIDVTGGVRESDTVNVEVGWNIIGSLSSPVVASSIIEVPSGIIQSAYYGYNGAYNAADTLHPSQGYWVKSSATGQLILGTGAVAVPAKPSGIMPATRSTDEVALPKNSGNE